MDPDFIRRFRNGCLREEEIVPGHTIHIIYNLYLSDHYLEEYYPDYYSRKRDMPEERCREINNKRSMSSDYQLPKQFVKDIDVNGNFSQYRCLFEDSYRKCDDCKQTLSTRYEVVSAKVIKQFDLASLQKLAT